MRRSLAWVVAVVLLLIGVREGLAGPPARVAILPIVVHTLEQKDYLRAGLADMLASRLGRIPHLAVIRIEGKDQATTDIKAAKKAGEAAGAEYVLFGSFTQFGEGASLDLQCARVDADAKDGHRSVFIHSGTLAEIIPRLDQVAEKVGRYLATDAATKGGTDGSLPPVSAAAPGEANPSLGEPLHDALSELESLRSRVDALEERVYSPAVDPVPDVNTEMGGDGFESDPELQSNFR
jgi:TolB-like protein